VPQAASEEGAAPAEGAEAPAGEAAKDTKDKKE